MKIDFKNFYLFSAPVDFNIAWLKIFSSNHLIVMLETGGRQAIGEGVLYQTSALKTFKLLKNDFNLFFNKSFSSLKDARQKLKDKFFKHPGLVCAFDTALWDLEAKLKKKPTHLLLGKKKRDKVLLAEQIFIPKDKEDLLKQVKEILKRKTRIIKLKAGQDLKKDIENLRLIRDIGGNQIDIHIDSNQGLNFSQAVEFASKLKSLNISAWEEPIKYKDLKELRRLKKRIKIPLILDESVKNKNEFEQAIKYKVIDILNLKISRLGGLTSALEYSKTAKENNIALSLGCSEELGIGTAGQLHLAAVLDNLQFQEGLGSQRLGFDLVNQSFKSDNGYLKILLGKKGLGVDFNFQKLRSSAIKMKFALVSAKDFYFPFNFIVQHYFTRLKSLIINGFLYIQRLLKPNLNA